MSLITQILYAIVFCARYLDIFTEKSRWNFFFKIIYITSSLYIIGVMQWLFPRTREREISWKLGAVILGGSLALSPFVMMIFEKHWGWIMVRLPLRNLRSYGYADFCWKWLWDFSQILESVCVLPQLLLLRQTTVPTVIDSFYLLALGSYRALYVLNWILREIELNGVPPKTVSVIFGIIQTALYIDFAWVYYTRQRVKLRNGGVVDADDMRRGWLLNRIFGKHVDVEPDDEESAPALGRSAGGGDGSQGSARRPGTRPKWGSRGISVSADDGILEQERANQQRDEELDSAVDPDAKMKDPDELARVLDDDDDDDDTLPSAHNGSPSGVNSGAEWRS